jgi:thiamine pyrophosphate-dependent acetolactate synthase large subunit-like protein
MPRLTGAQAVIASLRTHGVDTIFGIPGVHTLPIYDSLVDEPAIRHILARHEQGAGFMADGYARASGKPGVVCTISGPGVTNVATPVASAYADSIPLLVIATGLPRSSTGRRRGDLHELKDQPGVMEALAGWTRTIEYVEEIPEALRDAFRSMHNGRSRAAYLQIPFDLLQIDAEIDILAPAPEVPTPPTAADIAAVVRLLRDAKRPLIVAGAGVTAAAANRQLARLAELLDAPVLLGAKSHDALPNDHPLALVTSSYALPREIRTLVSDSDVVLVVGSKLGALRTDNGRLTFPSALIQVDIDPSEIGRNYPVAVGIVADARLVLDALLDALQDLPSDRPSRADEIALARAAVNRHVHRVFGESISMLDAVREGLPREGIVVADMTMLGYASAEYLPVYEPRTYIHSIELCSIGCGLPMALGAKVAAPHRPVVALCGDGGFLLNLGELATAVQEKIDVVAIVFNDATYTAVKLEQHQDFNRRYIATDLLAPDYVALARAFGVTGIKATSPDELREAIREAIHRTGLTLIEVPLSQEQW